MVTTRPTGEAAAAGGRLFEIAHRIVGERELDIDDRTAVWEITVQMGSVGGWNLKATEVKLYLRFDFTAESIAVKTADGFFQVSQPPDDPRNSDPTKVATVSFGELYPNRPVTQRLEVRTGAFSASDQAADPSVRSASPGLHNLDAIISYDIEPIDAMAQRSASTTLLIPVAPD